MTIYDLDASAWVKRYYSEVGTLWLQGLFSQNSAFACATLGLVEVASTFSRKQKVGQISAADFQRLFKRSKQTGKTLSRFNLRLKYSLRRNN